VLVVDCTKMDVVIERGNLFQQKEDK